MMTLLAGFSFSILLMSPATTWAECASVLWWNSHGSWEPIRAWPTRKACEEDLPHVCLNSNGAPSPSPWTRAGRR